MKVLLINPPLGPFDTIYAAIPILAGQLRYNNTDTDILDLNVEFFREIASPEYIKKTTKRITEIYNNNEILNEGINPKYQITKEQFDDLNKKIEKFLTKNKQAINYLENMKINYYDNFVNLLANVSRVSQNHFDKYVKIFYVIVSYALLPYYPEYNLCRLFGSNPIALLQNPMYKCNYEDIMDKCSNRTRNIFIDFYDKKIKELELNKYDVIGITIPFEQNTFPALTLSKILKEKTDAKIAIGGIIPTTTIDGFINHPDMFDLFLMT